MTRNEPTYLAAHNDAGLLRQYMARRQIGATLEFGGTSWQWKRARRLRSRLAMLLRITAAQATELIVADYRENDEN